MLGDSLLSITHLAFLLLICLCELLTSTFLIRFEDTLDLVDVRVELLFDNLSVLELGIHQAGHNRCELHLTLLIQLLGLDDLLANFLQGGWEDLQLIPHEANLLHALRTEQLLSVLVERMY